MGSQRRRVLPIFTFIFLQITATYSDRSAPSHLPSSSPKRPQRDSAEERVDYSNGFPSGFTQGLPTFDFSGPMTAASHPEQSSADTENVGFVHGPPDGFPSLSQLGAHFPSYEDEGQSSQSSQHAPPQRQYSSGPPHQGSPQYHHQVTHHGHRGGGESEEDFLGGPGPSSFQSQGGQGPSHRPLQKPLRLKKVRPRPDQANGGPPPHPQHFRPEGPGSSQYVQGGHDQQQHSQSQHHPHHQHQPNKPIVLKVSSKKTRPTNLPPLPPPFYAPSPDLQVASHKQNDGNPTYAASHHRPQMYNPQRFRREIKGLKGEDVNLTDQLQDGSDDTFWELSSPFIAFDNYEDEKSEPDVRNRSSTDPEAGEQRFFPSFPAPNPYLGLNPYITAPAARPTLFPGPTANRAPSRTHPQFGHKYAQVPLPPQRGPSGVYSAESHDHGDRYVDNNLLGSGNFEVVRGGTFYEDDENYHPGFHHGVPHQQPTGEDNGDYYHHNGHSSPSGFSQQPGSDFFANFRDFADINPSRSFSHNYESINLESAASERKPKNILDKLESRADTNVDDELRSHESDDPMMATY